VPFSRPAVIRAISARRSSLAVPYSGEVPIVSRRSTRATPQTPTPAARRSAATARNSDATCRTRAASYTGRARGGGRSHRSAHRTRSSRLPASASRRRGATKRRRSRVNTGKPTSRSSMSRSRARSRLRAAAAIRSAPRKSWTTAAAMNGVNAQSAPKQPTSPRQREPRPSRSIVVARRR
jgi:hypothetical protein